MASRSHSTFSLKRWGQLALVICTLAITGCNPSPEQIQQSAPFKAAIAKVEAQAAELESREALAVEREKKTAQLEAVLADKEKELANTQASLAKQFQEIEIQKKKLEAQSAAFKKDQEILQARLKRGSPPRVQAKRYMVIDAKTGDVLAEHNADVRGQIASTQKLLTALIIAETGNLDQLVTIEKSDTECDPVKFGLKVGEQYTRRDLLTALMLKSSNDISQALARDNAGSVAAFCEKMNRRAAQLGMADSMFMNPSGLPNEHQYSTPRDMAKVAMACDKNADIRAMVKTKTFTITRGDGRVVELHNTNRVLHSYEACDGMKTGFTILAGYCLVSSGEINGQRRIVLMFNNTRGNIWSDNRALLEWSLR